MKSFIFLLLFTFSYAFGNKTSPISNIYMDQVMASVLKSGGSRAIYMKNLTTYHILKYKNVNLNIGVKFEYFHSRIINMYHVKRYGDCTSIIRKNNTLNFSCVHSFYDIEFHYFGRISAEEKLLVKSFAIYINSTPFHAITEFKTSINQSDCVPSIEYFSLINNVSINYTIHEDKRIPKELQEFAKYGLVQYSINNFLSALNTDFVPLYRRVVAKSSILKSCFGSNVYEK
ncbi:uncharacterized protein LOC111642348 [Centruroides sculpturatus]|uniref:uncharacterized protein LOC111642348 n=1 Tax=Centruroides sculpturatus TaxID=218467 RepID=UPI000C6E3010|nr:uncharacterized protein LOC111642348 [Centruroides sculpturatus]